MFIGGANCYLANQFYKVDLGSTQNFKIVFISTNMRFLIVSIKLVCKLNL
jgi:hypothetical protein